MPNVQPSYAARRCILRETLASRFHMMFLSEFCRVSSGISSVQPHTRGELEDTYSGAPAALTTAPVNRGLVAGWPPHRHGAVTSSPGSVVSIAKASTIQSLLIVTREL